MSSIDQQHLTQCDKAVCFNEGVFAKPLVVNGKYALQPTSCPKRAMTNSDHNSCIQYHLVENVSSQDVMIAIIQRPPKH